MACISNRYAFRRLGNTLIIYMAIDLLKLEKKFIDLFQNTTKEEFEEWLLSKEREKETTSIQKYTIQISHYADGTSQMHRENNGFSVIELMGILEIVKENLLEVVSKPADLLRMQ